MTVHLTEERLIAVASGGSASDPHLDECPHCRRKHDAWREVVLSAREHASRVADEAMPESLLARQRREILSRVQQVVPNGRVLAFPTSSTAPTAPPRSASRWVAAAAAAGLVVGVFGGRLAHDFQVHTFAPSRVANRPAVAEAASAEEQLLDEVDVVLRRTGPAALGPLDELTPVAWDLRDQAP